MRIRTNKIGRLFSRRLALIHRACKSSPGSPSPTIGIQLNVMEPMDRNFVTPQSTTDSLDQVLQIKDEVPDQISKSRNLLNTYAEPFASQKLVNWALRGVGFGEFGGVHYYTLSYEDHGTRKLAVKKFKLCNFGWWLGTGFLITYMLFVLYQLKECLRKDDGFDFSKISLLYTVALLLMPLSFQTVSKMYAHELVHFTNNCFRFIKGYAKLFNTTERKPKAPELRIAELFLPLAFFGYGFVGIIIFVGPIFRPELKVFFSSLCEDPDSIYRIPMQILAVFMVVSIEYVYISGAYVYSSGMIEILILLPAIKALSVVPAPSGRGGSDHELHLYKQLFLIFDELNRACSVVLFPTVENVLVTLSAFGIYGTLRTSGLVRIALLATALICFTVVIILFWSLAQVNSASSQILELWKRDPRFDKRDLRALRPIQVQLGSYAYVDAGIIMTIVEVIVNYSITLLLTT